MAFSYIVSKSKCINFASESVPTTHISVSVPWEVRVNYHEIQYYKYLKKELQIFTK